MTQEEMTDRLRVYAELLNAITVSNSVLKDRYLMPGCKELADAIVVSAKKLLDTYCK